MDKHDVKVVNAGNPLSTAPAQSLKVRNFDENKVSNADLKKLFEKIGPLKACSFDRTPFGEFIGSATVVFEQKEDGNRAIKAYHGASLDDKVLQVEWA